MPKEITQPPSSKSLAKQRLISILYKLAAVFGVAASLLLIFMSRPLMARMSRQLCYSMYPASTGLWSRAWGAVSSTYTCEWMGHWGFNWYDIFSWATRSWHVLCSTLGGAGGFYALLSYLAKANKHKQNKTRIPDPTVESEVQEAHKIISDLDAQDLADVFEKIQKGQLPMRTRDQAQRRTRRERRESQRALSDTGAGVTLMPQTGSEKHQPM